MQRAWGPLSDCAARAGTCGVAHDQSTPGAGGGRAPKRGAPSTRPDPATVRSPMRDAAHGRERASGRAGGCVRSLGVATSPAPRPSPLADLSSKARARSRARAPPSPCPDPLPRSRAGVATHPHHGGEHPVPSPRRGAREREREARAGTRAVRARARARARACAHRSGGPPRTLLIVPTLPRERSDALESERGPAAPLPSSPTDGDARAACGSVAIASTPCPSAPRRATPPHLPPSPKTVARAPAARARGTLARAHPHPHRRGGQTAWRARQQNKNKK